MDANKIISMLFVNQDHFEEIVYLTLKETIEKIVEKVIDETVEKNIKKAIDDGVKKVATKDHPRYVKGLKGIRELFGVSHATAQRYKDTILKDAVSQQGRVIIVDVEKALELFNEAKTNETL